MAPFKLKYGSVPSHRITRGSVERSTFDFLEAAGDVLVAVTMR
jgi:hypothetical protein